MHVKNKDEAEKMIQDFLNKTKELNPNTESMLVNTSLTDEKSWGWIIYYQSQKYIETKNEKYLLAGNGPYFVNKNTGEMLYTGTAETVEKYIEWYENQLSSDS